MKYYNKHLRLIIGFLLPLLLMGCFSSKYIERKQYLLDLTPVLGQKATLSYSCNVAVDHVIAEAPFDQLDFLYRIKSGRYLTDYYNGFLAPPSGQLDTILKVYLAKYGKFNLVESNAKNRLQVKLIELYADYRDSNNPKAVVAMRFVLTKLNDGKSKVLVDKVLRVSIPLQEKNTNNLLIGWNKGIRDLMQQGVRLLNRKITC